jgi:hypothetical protein
VPDSQLGRAALPRPRVCALTVARVQVCAPCWRREEGAGLQPLGDCWALDTVALRWRQLSIQGDVPCPRNAAVLVAVGGALVYHGGWRPFQETYNDTFLLELLT